MFNLRCRPFRSLALVLLAHLNAAGAADRVAVTDAWSRATPPGADVAAAYLEIAAGPNAGDTLLGVASPLAKRAEAHETVLDGDIMKMRSLGELEIAPGTRIVFEPGGRHIMLMGLEDPLEAGDRFSLTLRFEHAGDVTVDVQVRPLSADNAHRDDHGKHAHD